MIRHISSLVKRIMPGSNFKKALFRWGTETEPAKIHARIDWANEDHCGACGNPFKEMEKQKQINTTEKTKNIVE